jgi:DNA-binding transcriptional LysR family regulator
MCALKLTCIIVLAATDIDSDNISNCHEEISHQMLSNISLSAINTFAIAAQEENFTRAADILHITPSAVSHRIKTLEAQLNVSLFARQAKGVELTHSGSVLLAHISKGMRNIHQGLELCQLSDLRDKLTIAVVPSLCSQWLVQRLPRFYALHANIDLELVMSDQLVDFNARQVDAHIHFGSGEYYGLQSTFLGNEFVYPVCHPDLLKGYKTANLACLLEHYPLLNYKAGIEDKPGGFSWEQWFASNNIEKPAGIRQLWFSHLNISLIAASTKQGIALGWHKVVSKDIQQGNLVKIGNNAQQTRFNYYLVMSERQAKNPNMQLFSHWLLKEFKLD